jgi:hypothetical protein
LTCTVKLVMPAVAGVPVVTPVAEFKDRPGGSMPSIILQV